MRDTACTHCGCSETTPADAPPCWCVVCACVDVTLAELTERLGNPHLAERRIANAAGLGVLPRGARR